jgi:hypothetical protein
MHTSWDLPNSGDIFTTLKAQTKLMNELRVLRCVMYAISSNSMTSNLNPFIMLALKAVITRAFSFK